jgi:hypothetical protein
MLACLGMQNEVTKILDNVVNVMQGCLDKLLSDLLMEYTNNKDLASKITNLFNRIDVDEGGGIGLLVCCGQYTTKTPLEHERQRAHTNT